MPSRLNPLGGLVHGSIEGVHKGLGPVPFIQPLCKHLHRPLSHLDLPSALIYALWYIGERELAADGGAFQSRCPWQKIVAIANCFYNPGPSIVDVGENLALSPTEAKAG